LKTRRSSREPDAGSKGSAGFAAAAPVGVMP
jgi:hypothetical protein